MTPSIAIRRLKTICNNKRLTPPDKVTQVKAVLLALKRAQKAKAVLAANRAIKRRKDTKTAPGTHVAKTSKTTIVKPIPWTMPLVRHPNPSDSPLTAIGIWAGLKLTPRSGRSLELSRLYNRYVTYIRTSGYSTNLCTREQFDMNLVTALNRLFSANYSITNGVIEGIGVSRISPPMVRGIWAELNVDARNPARYRLSIAPNLEDAKGIVHRRRYTIARGEDNIKLFTGAQIKAIQDRAADLRDEVCRDEIKFDLAW